MKKRNVCLQTYGSHCFCHNEAKLSWVLVLVLTGLEEGSKVVSHSHSHSHSEVGFIENQKGVVDAQDVPRWDHNL